MNGLWNQILVSRDAFLLESLAPYVDDEILERLQSVSPAQAGVEPRVIARSMRTGQRPSPCPPRWHPA